MSDDTPWDDESGDKPADQAILDELERRAKSRAYHQRRRAEKKRIYEHTQARFIDGLHDIHVVTKDVPGLGMVKVKICPTAYAEGYSDIRITKARRMPRGSPLKGQNDG